MVYNTTDAIKTIFQGALGAMTFGAYHQFTTNKIMELNNNIINLQMKEIKENNDKLIEGNNKLNEDIKKLKERRYLWF